MCMSTVAAVQWLAEEAEHSTAVLLWCIYLTDCIQQIPS
jgi:hypothetical protein